MTTTQTTMTIEHQTTITIQQTQRPLYKATSILIPISDLKGSSTNRKIDPKHVKRLVTDITENGLKFAITINEYGTIIEGHHRVEAFKILGLTEIPVDVKPALTESDVLKFNNRTKPWTPKNFHEILNDWVIDIHKKYNIPPQEVELALEMERGLLKRETTNPKEYNNYNSFVLFVDQVWMQVFNQMGKKANRNVFRATWRIYHKLSNVQADRLAESIIRERDEISRFTQMLELLKAISNSYNKRLSKGRITVDQQCNLYLND